jgi:membrane fusion protein (multidrug efflux system)
MRLACACVAAAAVLAPAGCRFSSAPPPGPPPVSVTVTVARRMTVPFVVNPIGTTRALAVVKVRARVRGFLTEKHFEDGKNVKKGDLLLVIDEEPFQVALKQAKAQLAAAKAAHEKATASKAREVARAQLALSEAQLRLDEVEERRERNLVARKAASQEDYDRADAQRKKSAAQVDANRASLEQTVSDYTIDIASAAADLAKAEAAVADAEINLSYCRMHALIDGRIGELQVKVGNLVGDTGQTELVTIEQLDPMGVDLYPPARVLPIATALQSRAHGVAVSMVVEGEHRHPHTGKTIFIDNHVDTNTSTFLVRASVRNPDGSLLPGQYIQATITVGEYVDAVVVPEEAVAAGQEGTRVFVVDGESLVQVAKVNAVDVYQGLRVLESGLEPGQRVIVEGIQMVRPGQRVTPVDAALDQFIQKATPDFNPDPRYTSPISRIPGMDDRTRRSESDKAVQATQEAGPTGGRPVSPREKAAPDSKKQAEPRTPPPDETKPR